MTATSKWATFRSSLAETAEPGVEPRGKAIAELLAQRLGACPGVEAVVVDLWRDSAYAIDARVDGEPVYTIVSYFGEGSPPSPPQAAGGWKEPCEWLLCCTYDRGWIARLLESDERVVAATHALARHLHGILAADPCFHEIRWYAAWDGSGPPKNGAPQPLGGSCVGLASTLTKSTIRSVRSRSARPPLRVRCPQS